MKETFSKKEPAQSPVPEQWIEFTEKQERDTRETLGRVIDGMEPEDFMPYSKKERERMRSNKNRVEENSAKFLKNKEYWSSKLREKEKELGFVPTEWWQKYFNFYIPRGVVDPKNKIKSGRDADKRIGLWLHKNGFVPKDIVVSLDVREYPEYIDSRVRDLVVRLNNLSFLKTTGSCAGHGRGDQESKVRGYDSADLHFVVNTNMTGGEEFLRALHQSMREFNEPLSAVSIGKSAYSNVHEAGTEDYSVEFRVPAPSQEWLDKHDKPYLLYTKVPEQEGEFEQLFRLSLKEEGKPVTDRAVIRLAYSYFDRLEKEYAGYSTSEEAKKRTDEFWQRIGKIVDQFLMRKNEFTTLADVPAIQESRYQLIATHEQLKKYVELPLLEACERLYDKNIKTLSTSANKKDIKTGEVYITIDFDSLSEKNKQIARQYANPEVFDDTQAVKIIIPVDETTTVDYISSEAIRVADSFEKQPAIWVPTYTLEDLKRGMHISPENHQFDDPEIWQREAGYYYNPKNKLFYVSEEHFKKANEENSINEK